MWPARSLLDTAPKEPWISVRSDSFQKVPGEDMPGVLRVLRMATHDAYHAGQIRYLRALQGA